MSDFIDLQLKRPAIFALLDKDDPSEGISAFFNYRKELIASYPLYFYSKDYYNELKISKKLFIDKMRKLSKKYSDSKNYTKSQVYLKAAFKCEKHDEELLIDYIICLRQAGIYDLEKVLAKRLIHSFPKQKNYEYLSKAYSNNEEHSEALKYYKKFINGIKKLSDGQKSRLGCIYYALYKETHNPEFAETCFNYYKEIVDNNPRDVIDNKNLYAGAKICKKLDVAMKCWKSIEDIANYDDEDRFSYAACALRCANFEEYGKYAETRFTKPNDPAYYPEIKNKPRWTGEDISDKTVLVVAEQGFGDSFLFYGYVVKLSKIAKNVIFSVQKKIYNLIKNNQYGIRVIPNDTDLESVEFDYHIPAGSLQYTLKLDINTMPVPVGYIQANKKLAALYKEKFFNTDKLKVGVAISGSDAGEKNRDIPYKTLKLLNKIKNAKFFCLTTEVDTKKLKKIFGRNVVNVACEFDTFVDTAAAIENCDVIVSGDNCILNLAGAMGKKVYGAFTYHFALRWYDLTGETSGYFKTVKPFVNDAYDRWDITIKKIVDEINLTYNEENKKSS